MDDASKADHYTMALKPACLERPVPDFVGVGAMRWSNGASEFARIETGFLVNGLDQFFANT